MKKYETVDNVVGFAQSATHSGEFKNDLPISEELKVELLTEVYNDFAREVVGTHFKDFQELMQEYIDEHQIPEEKRHSLEHNLFWWKVLYQASIGVEILFVQEYIAKNYSVLKHKPLIISWLKQWEMATTKFYYVGFKHNDRTLVLIDILTEETLDVVVYDRNAIPPIKGEIVVGTILPIGDALYFPILDFYHFDYRAREHIATLLPHYYERYQKNSTEQEAFIHVLSAALQVERILRDEEEKGDKKD
ncbi:hypothetical protein AB685_16535 [Bacillus sp. LL01]|uniref:hypothetical protein n=1 Tax=Bacillus sp. LL01 TaxID=1665556 RepID=UPI00064CF081|nr:hypothetical protein [Bacillus sp. LL01]KMJ57605.1 hypothetical protein AB685_16535 [Bacillus sp. LL01]